MQAAADTGTRGLEDRGDWRTDSQRGKSTAGTALGGGGGVVAFRRKRVQNYEEILNNSIHIWLKHPIYKKNLRS